MFGSFWENRSELFSANFVCHYKTEFIARLWIAYALLRNSIRNHSSYNQIAKGSFDFNITFCLIEDLNLVTDSDSVDEPPLLLARLNKVIKPIYALHFLKRHHKAKRQHIAFSIISPVFCNNTDTPHL